MGKMTNGEIIDAYNSFLEIKECCVRKLLSLDKKNEETNKVTDDDLLLLGISVQSIEFGAKKLRKILGMIDKD